MRKDLGMIELRRQAQVPTNIDFQLTDRGVTLIRG